LFVEGHDLVARFRFPDLDDATRFAQFARNGIEAPRSDVPAIGTKGNAHDRWARHQRHRAAWRRRKEPIGNPRVPALVSPKTEKYRSRGSVPDVDRAVDAGRGHAFPVGAEDGLPETPAVVRKRRPAAVPQAHQIAPLPTAQVLGT